MDWKLVVALITPGLLRLGGEANRRSRAWNTHVMAMGESGAGAGCLGDRNSRGTGTCWALAAPKDARSAISDLLIES